MTTLYLLIWSAYIGLDIWTNYQIIEVNKRRPNYLLMNIIRGVAFIIYGRIFWDAEMDKETLYVFIYCVTSFWLIFDMVLNVIRNKHPLYIGSDSGWIDQFGFKYPGVYYIAKGLAVAALVYSIVKIYQE